MEKSVRQGALVSTAFVCINYVERILNFCCFVAQEIDGLRTEIIVQPFSDRTMVMVTQLNKIGTLVSARDHAVSS
jgi:hypothetical protein